MERMLPPILPHPPPPVCLCDPPSLSLFFREYFIPLLFSDGCACLARLDGESQKGCHLHPITASLIHQKDTVSLHRFPLPNPGIHMRIQFTLTDDDFNLPLYKWSA
ncbi:hypothetical protein L2E82_45540 [Cichorium intybus]|uniref:Uncharacterized protein n=1 Tax=Cichorium intybus TaxID=13427 RepID=A0ACB8ZU91_CICIN|nr:hypothetical protein L2E82_45540 [Cichorium intybus]